jgi:mannose-6-phosphate isomerase class I
VITVSEGTSFVSEEEPSVDIAICMEGRAIVQVLKSGDVQGVDKGVSVLIPAAAGAYQIKGEATLFKATVGRHF